MCGGGEGVRVRVFILAGSPVATPPGRLTPGPDDRVIAADYGAHHALTWGWPVHLLIGDLDSLPPADLQALQATGVPTIVAPAAKDETDLELALAQALAGGATEVIFCAALGGRADHMLANILLLARRELVGVAAVIADGSQAIHLLRGSMASEAAPVALALMGAAGDLLTLLPLAGDAEGVTTAGLLYPLDNETLFFAQARGVSNVFAQPAAHVRLRRGLLLVIHTMVVV